MKDLKDGTERSIPLRCEEYSTFCLSGDGLFCALIPELMRTVQKKSDSLLHPGLLLEYYLTKVSADAIARG